MDFSYISSILIPLETGGVEIFFYFSHRPMLRVWSSFILLHLSSSNFHGVEDKGRLGFLYYRSHHFLLTGKSFLICSNAIFVLQRCCLQHDRVQHNLQHGQLPLRVLGHHLQVHAYIHKGVPCSLSY